MELGNHQRKNANGYGIQRESSRDLVQLATGQACFTHWSDETLARSVTGYVTCELSEKGRHLIKKQGDDLCQSGAGTLMVVAQCCDLLLAWSWFKAQTAWKEMY